MTRGAPADPALLAEGDRKARQELDLLNQRLDAQLKSLDAALRREVTESIAGALSAARDAHAALLADSGLEIGEAGEDEEEASWSRLRSYREGVARDVVGPLLAHLQDRGAGPRVSTLWRSFLDGLESEAARLPAEVLRSEPPEVYRPSAEDGAGRRVVKARVRAVRTFTGIFARNRVREQRVPLQQLARDRWRVAALPGVIDLHESLQLHYAALIADLERALGRWLQDWFPLEDATHGPEAHLHGESAEQLEAVRETLGPVLAELGLTTPPAAESAKADPETEQDPSPRDDETQPGEPEADGSTLPPDPTPAHVAQALQEALEELASVVHPDEVVAEVRSAMETSAERLRAAVRDADTPLARRTPRGEEDRLQRLRDRLAHRAVLWTSWYLTASNRLRLSREVLDFRRDLDRIQDRLMDEVVRSSVLHLADALREARERLLDLRQRASDPTGELQSSSDRKAVARAVDELLAGAEEALEGRLTDPLGMEALETPVQAAADRAAEAIAERVRALPESLEVHAVRERALTLEPGQSTRMVRLQEIYRQSLDVLHLESLRTSPAPLVTALAEARQEAREVPTVVEYNLAAARNELLAEEEKEDAAVLEDARGLVLQGLERSARSLDQVVATSLPAWRRFARGAHEVLHRAAVQGHDRVTLERAVQEQFADLRSIVEARIRRTREEALKLWGMVRRQGEHAWRRVEILLKRLVRRGRLALGADQVQAGEAERAMEVLRSVPALLEPLPLVYRRLFSFQPVTDPSLLVGREEEAAWAARRFDAWREGIRSPSLLTGHVTVGHTSLFNILGATLFKDARVVRLNFPERCRDEEALAERIATELRMAEFTVGEEGPWTLARLERFLLERDTGDGGEAPLVILVEQLPHLVLRVPGGMELAEKFLEFQARTASGVFWLSSTSDPMWKLFSKVSPRGAALVKVGNVSPLSRSDMEKLLMVRHQRSGVPLDFLAPQDANPLLRRKLQRVRNEEERYEILKEEFFDRLYRASQGNVPMAILLWLKSADFSSQEGWLQLRPPRPIRFSFLEEMDLALDFALKALMELGSLTVEEYAKVFSSPLDDAFQAMEALRSRSLLEPMSAGGGIPRPLSRVSEGEAYRIPPLLSRVVAQYLRNHNILH